MRFEHVHGNTTYYADNGKKNDQDLLEGGKGLDNTEQFTFGYMNEDKPFTCGSFNFSPMPGCCGIVVSHYTLLHAAHRGTIASQQFRVVKRDLARALGYSCIIATTQMQDVRAVKNMFKSGYDIRHTFTNTRTNNLLGIGVKLI